MSAAIKDAVPELPLVIHTHCTTGLAFMTDLKAVEAGADVIDTAISPFSGGTSQPATETLAYALRQLGYQVDLDDKVLVEMADFFKASGPTSWPTALWTPSPCPPTPSA